MVKFRLGVVLLVPPPLDREIDVLRRATGDGTYGRVPAHLTLVPPVNVRPDRRDDAMAAIRKAAEATRPAILSLGPPGTFLPFNPVLFLPVLDDGSPWVVALRDRVFVEPLARPLTWPFVPHVTLADEAEPERIEAARVALSSYAAEMAVERVHVLEEGPGRVWAPVADFAFSPPAVIGRGGLPVELSVTHRLDPEAEAFAARAWEVHDRAELGGPLITEALAITARRRGEMLGVATATTRGGVARLSSLIVDAGHRGEGVGSHLLAAFESEAALRGSHCLAASIPAGSPAEQFLRRRGWDEAGRLASWYRGRPFVQLHRWIGEGPRPGR